MRLFPLLFAVLFSCSSCAATPKGTKALKVVKITFKTDVTYESALEMELALDLATKAGADAIMVVIDSPGGSVSAGWDIVKAIQSSPVPVSCIVEGEADSMAFVILQSCSSRAMLPTSRLMIHQPYAYLPAGPAHIPDLKGLLSDLESLADQMIVFCSVRMRLTYQAFKDQISGSDWWLSSVIAVKWNAVDVILPSVAEARTSLERDGRF